ncbi:MAG: adenosylcobinamide-GDP ribazoletransferase [Deltaproteobacteria bacterium]|nr:adenosylcobinamide-GDP ribazoletransferase [Deltaproteobacteria bacterium]
MRVTFPLALTFLTKIPWPRPVVAGPEDLARSLFWFPWVGGILGLIFLGSWSLLLKVLPIPAAAALLVSLNVWITGGLHLDGLADTMDGLGGGHDPETRRRIMKDSRVGTFGVLALILVLLLKFVFFLAAADRGWRYEFILFPVLSRWGMVYLAYLSDYARPEGGLGQAMTTGVSPRVAAGASISAAILAVLLLGFKGLGLWAIAGALVWLGSRYFRKSLGGVTGDVLGAANEILEAAVLGGALIWS